MDSKRFDSAFQPGIVSDIRRFRLYSFLAQIATVCPLRRGCRNFGGSFWPAREEVVFLAHSHTHNSSRPRNFCNSSLLFRIDLWRKIILPRTSRSQCPTRLCDSGLDHADHNGDQPDCSLRMSWQRTFQLGSQDPRQLAVDAVLN